jgi:electron transport complex protein RnfB
MFTRCKKNKDKFMDISILWDTLKAALSLGLLGSGFALLLYSAFKKLAVKTDPRVELIMFSLPGSNCGACGFAGCLGLAEKLVEDKNLVTGCLAGGQTVAKKLAEVMGVSLQVAEDRVAFVACRAGRTAAKVKYKYEGVNNCQAAHLFFGGDKACTFGCLGLGSCMEACPFDAISITKEGIALVDQEKCRSCEKCVKACPRHLISMQPKNQAVLVACKNLDKAKKAREVCSLSCIACKICEKNCPEKAIVVQNNLAVIDFSKCTQCGICIEKCPQKTIIKLAHLA